MTWEPSRQGDDHLFDNRGYFVFRPFTRPRRLASLSCVGKAEFAASAAVDSYRRFPSLINICKAQRLQQSLFTAFSYDVSSSKESH